MKTRDTSEVASEQVKNMYSSGLGFRSWDLPKLTESKDTVIKKNQSWFNDASVQIVRVIFKSSIRHLQEADSSTGIAANIASSAFYMAILCVEPHTMAP